METQFLIFLSDFLKKTARKLAIETTLYIENDKRSTEILKEGFIMANIEAMKNGAQETEETKVLTPDEVSDPPKDNDADKPKEEENPSWFKRTLGRVKDFGHEVRTHLPLVGGSALVGAGLGVTGVILLDRLLGNKTEDADAAEERTDGPNEVPALEEPFEAPEMVPIPTPEEREVDVD